MTRENSQGLKQAFQWSILQLLDLLDREEFEELPALAERHGWSCDAAAYLWFALAHQAPLMTHDRKHAAAYLKAGNEIL